jgi:glycosyltransferase involved in cell wall biosynthesis
LFERINRDEVCPAILSLFRQKFMFNQGASSNPGNLLAARSLDLGFLRHRYYDLKPHLPVSIRMAIRKWIALRTLKRSRAVWPINTVAARKPEGWVGWPANKRFALVLTHDVEGLLGLTRCRELMDLEMSLGFRSSFNFIPEGEYQTPPELRKYLVSNGFEVGVHDLRHDGKLYRSKKDFQASAEKINSYLREWNAVGFRSGFMHHNLEWLHGLDIKYDMSTFDTDPFEPQPDGVDTIFPFWVGSNESGYLEMPYTLPQDSTLFLLLEQPDISTWKAKLDWIARQGGMALINVHPDYLNFSGEIISQTYSAQLYREFLSYVTQHYKGQYWHALPRDVAAYCAEFRPTFPKRKPKRVAMVSYSFYESDNRVMRYADTLADRGDEVDIFAIYGQESTPKFEVLNGVRVHRLQRREKNETGKLSYLLPLVRFLFRSSAVLSWRHLKRRYDVVHVHNVPDFLIFSAWLPRLTGSRLILDIHDIVPEFFESKFKEGAKAGYVKLLKGLEKACCGFAHHVIISNHLWYKKIIKRSVMPENCSVVLNCVDPAVFYPRTRTRSDGKLVVLFPGGLQWHQGLDIAIRAFPDVLKVLPNCELHIYGDGNAKSALLALRDKMGLREQIKFFSPLPIQKVAVLIANADLGIVPKRADGFGNEAYSTKIMEFMSQGIPVVASRTKIDTFYFRGNTVYFYESGNHVELASAIVLVLSDRRFAKTLVENAHEYVAMNDWSKKRHSYFAIVDNIENPASSDFLGPGVIVEKGCSRVASI